MNTHFHVLRAPQSAVTTSAARTKFLSAGALTAMLTVSGIVFAVMSAPRADAVTVVDLGTSEQFAVLAGAGVTNTGPTTIQTHDAGVRGDAGTFPDNTATGTASMSWISPAAGSWHLADSVAQIAQADNLIAYNAAAGAASNTSLGAQLDGAELLAGVHTASSALNLATNGTVTFNAQGDPDAEFIIQVGSSLTMEVNSTVALTNGAQACHIFWQVSEDATVKANATFVGTILAENAIVAQSGASFEGRLLAQNASVTLDSNTFTMPGCSPPVTGADTDTDTTGTDTTGTDTDSDTTGTDTDSDTTGTDTDSDTTGTDADSDTTDIASSDSDTTNVVTPPGATTPLPDTGGSWLGLVPVAMAAVMLGATAISVGRRRVRGVHRAE